MQVWRPNGVGAGGPSSGVTVGEAAPGNGSAEDARFVFVGGRPVGDLGGRRDLPVGHDALSRPAVFSDCRQVGEEVAELVGIANGAPCQGGGWGGHHGNYSALVTADAVVDHAPADDWAEVLQSSPVGAGEPPADVRFGCIVAAGV